MFSFDKLNLGGSVESQDCCSGLIIHWYNVYKRFFNTRNNNKINSTYSTTIVFYVDHVQ